MHLLYSFIQQILIEHLTVCQTLDHVLGTWETVLNKVSVLMELTFQHMALYYNGVVCVRIGAPLHI